MWHRCKNNCTFLLSRLARALWIEINYSKYRSYRSIVEARESLVDRNISRVSYVLEPFIVEARESLVDRNSSVSVRTTVVHPSRLARALWIEI